MKKINTNVLVSTIFYTFVIFQFIQFLWYKFEMIGIFFNRGVTNKSVVIIGNSLSITVITDSWVCCFKLQPVKSLGFILCLCYYSTTFHMFIANWPKSWRSSCTRNSKNLQNRQGKVQPDSQGMDYKICHVTSLWQRRRQDKNLHMMFWHFHFFPVVCCTNM